MFIDKNVLQRTEHEKENDLTVKQVLNQSYRHRRLVRPVKAPDAIDVIWLLESHLNYNISTISINHQSKY
jgi:hypothetical protein